MNKHLYVYSDIRILKPKTMKLMHLGHIPHNNDHYVVSSSYKCFLTLLKEDHKYYVSKIKETDLIEYCVSHKYKLLSIHNAYCDVESRKCYVEYNEYEP